MKIEKVTDTAIIFNNGMQITYDHEWDCCEHNYADFSILNPNVINYDRDFAEMHFEKIDEMGFRFGEPGHWIFIPCYSHQNGYYTSNIDIYFWNPAETLDRPQPVLSFSCETVIF